MPTACPGEDAWVTAAPTGRTTARARTGRTAPTTSTGSCCGDRGKCRLSRASTSRTARGCARRAASRRRRPTRLRASRRTAGPATAARMNGGPTNGGPMPGRQYRLPNGRRVPPRADRPYRPQAPGPAGGLRRPWDQPGPGQAPGPPGQDPLGGWGRPPRPRAPGGPPPGGDAGPHAYGSSPGGTGMPGAAGFPGTAGHSGASQFPGTSGFSGGPAGSRAEGREGREGWGRLGTQAPRGTAGPVIRQRENAVPGERPAAHGAAGGQHRAGRARVVRAGPAGAARPRPSWTTPRWPRSRTTR